MVVYLKRCLGGLILALILVGVGQATADPLAEDNLAIISANPVPTRDPITLAVRFQGLDPDQLNYAPRPAYQIGEREQFILSSSLQTEPTPAEMILAGMTDQVYLWVEADVITYDPVQTQALAERISTVALPRIRETFGAEAPLPSDSRIYIFTVRDAGAGLAGVFNDTDRYPNELFSTSNEVNSLMMAISPNDYESYLPTVAHEFQHLVQASLDESEETWFIEGFAELGSLLAEPDYFDSLSRQGDYLESSTGNQLNTWAGENENSAAYYAASSLFLTYITQRVGEGWLPVVASEPSDGLLGIDRALATTGSPFTANDLFADFVVTNYLNDPTVAEGQFAYSLLDLYSRADPDRVYNTYPVNLPDGVVNQYGTQYIALDSQRPQTLLVNFQGDEQVSPLPTSAHSGDYFWWSQQGNQGNARLVGRFDLTTVPTATLRFWTWYALEEFWDYGYVSLSTDNGATWQLLTAPTMTAENPYSRAFGMGFTGRSGGDEAQVAPYVGFGFSDNTLVVESIADNSPAAAAGLQAGDFLMAINGESLTSANFFPVLDQYQPNETILLTVNRANQFLDLTVTLGAHPTRLATNPADWVQESLDLTPYVGQEVLISFDYVTDQATIWEGWLIDDVEIPEIGFFDDMETPQPVWESQGWVRITNALPQDYLIQLIHFGETVEVSRLMQPQDANSGVWAIPLQTNERAVLAISGMAPFTQQPTTFRLAITNN